MKNFLSSVVLVLTLVHSQKDVYAHPKMIELTTPRVTVRNTEDALENLIQEGKPIPDREYWFLSPTCTKLDMKCLRTDYGYHRCDFEKTCYVVGLPWDELRGIVSLHVISKDKSEKTPGGTVFANTPKYQAVILPFAQTEDTYMILDPDRAPWFFTAPLTGCDIFVATAENQGNKPLVIHSNRNQITDQIENLKTKGDSVNSMLAKLNGNYRVIARAYFLPTNPPDLVHSVKAYIDQYVQNHHQQGIQLLTYNNDIKKQLFYFFGHYVMEQQLARWRFYLKGQKDGALSHFDVSQQGNVMK